MMDPPLTTAGDDGKEWSILVYPSMNTIPKEIHSSDGQLSILWSDGHRSVYDCRDLRLACRCAACVDEWSHENLIRPEQVPPLITPLKIEVVGNYALHFEWSDHHATGIYTYDYLRDLCGCEECKASRSFSV